jgi:hypothetical protein
MSAKGQNLSQCRCPPQTPHDLTWSRILAVVVGKPAAPPTSALVERQLRSVVLRMMTKLYNVQASMGTTAKLVFRLGGDETRAGAIYMHSK